MKYLIVFFFINLTINCSSQEVSYKSLKKANGFYYQNNYKELYSGQVTGELEGQIIEGKKEGIFFKYFNNCFTKYIKTFCFI